MALPAGADRAPGTSPAATRAAGPALSVEGLSVWLGGREVLHDVSFTVAEGEVTGLIGMNGAGKTTLLRALLGLQPIASGKITLARGRSGRQSTGYVPQKVVLDADLPVRARDLVELGLDGRRLGLPTKSRSKRATVEELLASVDALPLADARVGALSGGEQQKVLIAHALARHPLVLLLDEPLSNLDLPSTQETVELLGRIAKQQDVAILISTHDINPLLPVMDRVVYLASGRAASGRTDEVVRSDVLSSLYGRHVDVFHAHGRVLVSVGDDDEQAHEAPFEVVDHTPGDRAAGDRAPSDDAASDRAAGDRAPSDDAPGDDGASDDPPSDWRREEPAVPHMAPDLAPDVAPDMADAAPAPSRNRP